MTDTTCPICDARAKHELPTGDASVILCDRCGCYKIADTVLVLFDNGSLERPMPEPFRELVRRKRGDSSEWPTITQYDLETL